MDNGKKWTFETTLASMKQPPPAGIELRERCFKSKTTKVTALTFTASEAIDWFLRKQIVLSREGGVEYGCQLQRLGFLVNVPKVVPKVLFADSSQLHFQIEEPQNIVPLQLNPSPESIASPRRPALSPSESERLPRPVQQTPQTVPDRTLPEQDEQKPASLFTSTRALSQSKTINDKKIIPPIPPLPTIGAVPPVPPPRDESIPKDKVEEEIRTKKK